MIKTDTLVLAVKTGDEGAPRGQEREGAQATLWLARVPSVLEAIDTLSARELILRA